jgi:hypothetical protein
MITVADEMYDRGRQFLSLETTGQSLAVWGDQLQSGSESSRDAGASVADLWNDIRQLLATLLNLLDISGRVR